MSEAMRLRWTSDRLRRAGLALRSAPGLRPLGSLLGVRGSSAEVRLPGARLGDRCRVGVGAGVGGEVVSLSGDRATLLLQASAQGLAAGASVAVLGRSVPAGGVGLLGRVIDPLGRPLDGGGPPEPRRLRPVPLDADPPAAHLRRPVREPLWTGVRVLDALCTLGRGQRVGLFAPAGTGKTRLMSQIVSQAEAEVVVVALVGERGRELQEWLSTIPPEDRRRMVTVAATSDMPAHLRARATPLATAVARHFRSEGREVLLVVDSLTRHLRAQREIALAAGEGLGPTGYPASALGDLPRLLERAGNDERGRLTALYTVLEEVGEGEVGLEEELRGLLDGHLILSRTLAERGHFPALDPCASISRLADQVVDQEHRVAAARLRRWIRLYEERRELMILGAWEPGRDAEGDEALARWPEIEAFLRQGEDECASPEELRRALLRMAT